MSEFLRRQFAVPLIFILMVEQGEPARAQNPESANLQLSVNSRSRHILPGFQPAQLCERSGRVIIPRVDFRGATVQECIDYLRETGRKIERSYRPDFINFVLKLGKEDLQKAPRVTFQAENSSLLDVVDEITRQANLAYRIAPYAIEIGNANGFITKPGGRTYVVPPTVFPECTVHFNKGSELGGYVRYDVRNRLRRWGLAVPEQGSAYYFPATYELFVSGDEKLLGSIEGLVEKLIASHSFPPEERFDYNPGYGPGYGVRGNWQTRAKLQRIIFPRIEMREATTEEAFEFFFRKTKELDTTEPDEAKRGIRVSLALRPAVPDRQPEITLSVENIPAIDVLKYMTELAGTEYEIQMDGTILIQTRSAGPKLVTRTYGVPRERINLANGSLIGPDGVTYPSVQQLCSAFGVVFPEGSSASLNADAEIVVRNTERNLAITDVIVAALIDSGVGQLSAWQLTKLREIIADARVNGEIRPPLLFIAEG